MNDVNKNLRAFHLSIDELLKALALSYVNPSGVISTHHCMQNPGISPICRR